MSRRHEDFDEFCDPANPRILDYDDVVEAAKRIRPYIKLTPCVPSKHQRDFGIQLYYKEEFLQTSGSFKERGAVNALQMLPLDKRKIGIVIASLGNEAVSMCYHAAKMSVPMVVVIPNGVPVTKIQICHGYGAKVVVQGNNLVEAMKYARAIARDKGLTYINSRDYPPLLAGYATVALEILEQVPTVDAIIVPVGTGALAAGVATVVKRLKNKCHVYGVQPENMPTFSKSLENEEPLTLPLQHSLADAIAVPFVGVNGYHTAAPLLDKMLLVTENWIAHAMLHLIEKERFVVEASGACPLAAIIGSLVPEFKTKTVVCILSGGNVDPMTLARCLDRGLTADCRLVKFSVGIPDDVKAHTNLLKLLAFGGYNLVRQTKDNVWLEDDTPIAEIKLVCETKDLEHALELKRMIERAYPYTSSFETEPFNDKRACPCYVWKLRKN